MSYSTFSIVPFTGIAEVTDSLPIEAEGYSNLLFSLNLSAMPTGGSAQVVLAYLNAAGNWQRLAAISVDGTTSEQPDAVHMANIPLKKLRVSVAEYTGLVNGGSPVYLTASLELSS
jgi:hypothetical protein